MDPIIKEIKKRLRKEGFSHLRVQRGRGTGHCWLEIYRPDPGEMLSIKEEKAICKVFGEKYEGSRGNMYTIRAGVAEMKLGLREKKPVCEFCGCTFKKEEHARACEMSH